MASLNDVLKRLNKSKSDSDQYKVASKQKEDYFDWKFCTSTSDKLDHHLGGGIPCGLVINTGKNAAGKTSLSLMVAGRITQQKKTVIYFDGEHSVKRGNYSFPAKDLGVDFDYFIHHKGSNLEEMLDAAEAFATSEDVGMIIIDSLKAFNPTAMEEKSATQTGMGNQARKYGERINILLDLCERRNILLWCINQWRTDLGVMHGDNRTLPGGGWQEYFACLIIDLTKKELLRDENKKVIGHKMHVRVKKSKIQAHDPTEVLELNYLYGIGFDKVEDSVEALINKGIIVQAGSWFSFPEQYDQENIQGKDKVIEHLKSNPELLEALRNEK